MENRASYPPVLDRLIQNAFIEGTLTIRETPGAFELAVYRNGIVNVIARTPQISSGDYLSQYENALVESFGEARAAKQAATVEAAPKPSERVTDAQARRAAFKVVS